MQQNTVMQPGRAGRIVRYARFFHRDYQVYAMLLPSILLIIVFNYIPMYGLLIAFKDFRFKDGVMGSAWAGFKYFSQFLSMPQFWTIFKNTLLISLYSLVVGTPAPILLAILLNECIFRRFKKTVQMISYAPHFISTVVMCGMILLFLNRGTGIINNLIAAAGLPRVDFMIEPAWFKTVYVFSGIWQDVGWSSIIFLAALSGVDPGLIEASVIDGANRFQKIRHVDLPTILPTIIILMIFGLGSMLSVGFEKILLLQNGLNMDSSDVISTYVYRVGLKEGQYSLTTAIGMFNSVANLILLVAVNWASRIVSGISLW